MEQDKILILGVSGSPKHGATSRALRLSLDAAGQVPGVETACIDLAGKRIHCCTGCNACRTRALDHCPVFQDDFTDEYMSLYLRCDGILLASPLYSMNPTGLLMNFLNRMRPSGGSRIPRGIAGMRMGGCIAVGGRRNGGQDAALSAMNAALQSTGTNVIGGGVYFYNGAAVWSRNDKNFDDPTGVLELEALGRKVAWASKIVRAGLAALDGQVTAANCSGFLSDEQLSQAREQLGLS